MNNARRILPKGSTLLRGCWFRSKKLRFRKNFDKNFNAVERVRFGNKFECMEGVSGYYENDGYPQWAAGLRNRQVIVVPQILSELAVRKFSVD
jgi:hypothetical protein